MSGKWEGGAERLLRFPPNWRQIKAEVWRTKGSRCHLCGQGGADTIDHIDDPHDHTLANLAPVHDRNPPHCHRYKSSAQGNAKRAAMRKSEARPAEAHPGLLPGPAPGPPG